MVQIKDIPFRQNLNVIPTDSKNNVYAKAINKTSQNLNFPSTQSSKEMPTASVLRWKVNSGAQIHKLFCSISCIVSGVMYVM